MSLPSKSDARLARARPWQYVLAGFAASLASIGLARFAYAPLVPALIEARWFSSASVVFLSAANLTGYLVGALLGQPMARRASCPAVLRAMMSMVTLSFLACAYPLSMSWFFLWRLLSGIAGGAIMVLVAATVLPHVPPQRRGIASGAIFLGIGAGIAGSGTVVPWLLTHGLRATWWGLAFISLALTLLTWRAWPRHGAPLKAPAPAGRTPAAQPAGTPGADTLASITVLFGQYGLMAVGLVPAMVFLVDFVDRGIAVGVGSGAHYWVVYGIGAIAGPPLYGAIGDRIGARPALRLALLLQATAVACLGVAHASGMLAVAAFVIGTFPPGIVPLALTRVHELIPHDPQFQNTTWSRATISFASFQALAGYGYSAAFSFSDGDHRLMFCIGAGALLVALIFDARWMEQRIRARFFGRVPA